MEAGTVATFPPAIGALPNANGALPTKEASNRGREQTTLRRSEALALMQKEREQIRQSLEAAYRAEFLLDISEHLSLLKTDLNRQLDEAADAALETISSWIYEHALDRSDNVVRMALIRGYPTQRRIANKEDILRRSAYETQLEAEWNHLRDDLTEKDTSFTTKLNDFLSDHLRLGNELRARLLRSIEAEIKRAEDMAKEKSRERLSNTSRLDIPSLLDASAGRLPPLLAKGSTVPEARAEFSPNQGTSINMNNESEVFAKLNIWLSLQGYKLARSPKGVTDRTAEFTNWLKNN